MLFSLFLLQCGISGASTVTDPHRLRNAQHEDTRVKRQETGSPTSNDTTDTIAPKYLNDKTRRVYPFSPSQGMD